MKLAVFFWLTALMQVSANGLSQNVSLNLKAAPLKLALKEIEKQTRFSFTYTDDQLDKAIPVNLELSDMPLQRALDVIFSSQPLTYTIRNKTIVLADKPVVPLKDRLLITGSNKDRISGTVMSADDMPLVGATVLVKGSTKSTTTDVMGKFSIDANAGDILVITYVGYDPREIKLTEANIGGPHQIRLNEKMADLKEVEIVVAYGKQSKASYTGAASVVSSKMLEGKPRASFQESLQGNVAGLQSTTGTGQPGASGNVRIRGIGSYSASSSPLYVIDGVPFVDGATTVLAFSSNTLAGINPNDIESVTTLKDASATAIYGSRGANGVIIITTKSGANGRTKVNLNAQTGFSEIALTDRNKPLSTREMTELLIEGVINNKTGAMANINTNEEAYQYLIDQGLKPNVNTDWYDVITRKGKFHQYDLSMSGGNEKTTFFSSAGYYKQDATIRDQGFERASMRLRLKHKANKRLSLNIGLAPNFQKLSTIGNAGLGANPIRSLNRLVPWVTPYNQDGSYTALAYNPEIVRRENKYDTRIYAMLGDVGAELKLLPGLAAETKLAIDFSYTDDYRFWSPKWVDASSVKGRAAEYSSLFINWNITNLLRYNKQLGDFSMDATLGQEAQKIAIKYISTQADGFSRDGLYTLASAATPYVAWSNEAASSLVSYFLNTSFNYDRKVYLNLTGRIDGSSRFGKNVRYGKFGSIGLAWNLEDAPIVRDLGFVDALKLRASYGINGNQASEYYGVLGVYSTSGTYNGSGAFALSQVQNDYLTWEKNRPFDIGFEFAVLNNRLSGSFDYYHRVTSDLLMNAPVSATNGVATQNKNIGSFENSGIELTLNSENIRATEKKGFSWNTNFNISTNKNRILTLSGTDQIITGVFNREIGGDYYEFYLPGWAGVDEQTGEGLWYTDGTKKSTTKVFNQAAAFNQGSATPKFFGGLTNTFSYRDFTLSFMFYFNWGNKIYDSWGAFTSNDASSGVTDYGAIARVDYDNRWQKPGDKASSPKMVYRGSQTGTSGQNSSRFMYDGSYIRLRDVSISYDIPVKLEILQKAQVFVKGNNLLTFVKDERLRHDPETYVGGVLNQNLPISRQFLAGLNITF